LDFSSIWLWFLNYFSIIVFTNCYSNLRFSGSDGQIIKFSIRKLLS